MSSSRIYDHSLRCIYCQTEGKFVCSVDNTNLTTCPNNSGDTVNSASAYQEYDVVGENITGGSGINVGCYNTVIARPSGATALNLSLPPISVIGDEVYMYFRAEGATTTYLEPQSTDSINGGAAGATFAINTRITSSEKQVLLQTNSSTSDWTIVGGSVASIGLDRDTQQLTTNINLTQRGDARFNLRNTGDLLTIDNGECAVVGPGSVGNLLSTQTGATGGLRWITQGAAELLAYQFSFAAGPETTTAKINADPPPIVNSSWLAVANSWIITPSTFEAGTYRVLVSTEAIPPNNSARPGIQLVRRTGNNLQATPIVGDVRILFYAPSPTPNTFTGSTRCEVHAGFPAGINTVQFYFVGLGTGGGTTSVKELYIELFRIA